METTKVAVVRMEDPKAKAKPDLSYGGSSLSVQVAEDSEGHPVKLTVTAVVELPEATEPRKLNQDLLAATKTMGEARKYLEDREEFFKGQVRLRLKTKGCTQEAGFLTGELSPQNRKDWDWKEFALQQLATVIRLKEACSPKRARILAEAKAKELYDKAEIKDTEDRVSVKGVKVDA